MSSLPTGLKLRRNSEKRRKSFYFMNEILNPLYDAVKYYGGEFIVAYY